MNFKGIIIFIIHAVIILGIPPFIIFSKNKKLLLFLFIAIISSYILNLYYSYYVVPNELDHDLLYLNTFLLIDYSSI